jgi:dihydrofolate synthase/folylpolyglutamate synthase
MNLSNHVSQSFHTSHEAIAWILGLKSLGMKPGLQRMQILVERLDHPERKLRFIHVAGTNGKGSTCAFLASAIQACGYDVGCFTSPYIERYTDRIQFNSTPISDQAVIEISNQLNPIVEELAHTALGSPTMFEVTTALALQYYARYVFPDYVVWETGLGGRLDSTNIVHPLVSIITNVGYDHMELLGDTIAQIASEKAGIIKAGVPVISAIRNQEAKEICVNVAKQKKASTYFLGEHFEFHQTSRKLNEQRFDFKGPFRNILQMSISMNGEHQLENASTALMTIEVLRQYYAFIVDDEKLSEAFQFTQWPGRLEWVMSSHPILLDGAHNPDGAVALANALQKDYPHEKLNMIIGMISTKNHDAYLQHILPLVDTIIITEPDFPKKCSSHQLAQIAQRVKDELNLNVQLIIEPDWKQALQQLQSLDQQHTLSVVTGSLYLISDVRSWLISKSVSDKGW